MPHRFTLTTQQGSTDAAKLTCDVKTPPSSPTGPATIVDDYLLSKQAAKVTAPKTVKATAAQKAAFRVRIAGRYGAPTAGEVVAKEGRTVVGTGKLTTSGTAIVTLKRLKPGRHRIVLSFAGDGSFKPTKGKTVVKVAKK